MMTFITKALGVWFTAGAMLMPCSCQQADSYKVKVSGSMTVGNEWIELRPEPHLKAEKDSQIVYFELEPPFRNDLYKEGNGPNKGKGILMPDGEVINPEIEVIDQHGNTFRLVYSGGIGLKPTYELPYPNKWPRDRGYAMIRIRSPRPINVKAVYWFCESRKDMP